MIELDFQLQFFHQEFMSHKRINDYTQGRDNNFNLIRLVSAFLVLFSHSFPLAIGTKEIEPFRFHLNMTIGGFAVDVFFLTSGFLVAASLMMRQDVISFVCGRAMRIFPGLWVMLIFTALVLGGAVTNLPLPQYLSDFLVFDYILRCGSFVDCMSTRLPGLFESNPFTSGINGSLWTLPYEVGMYGALLGMWIVASAVGKNKIMWFKALIFLSSALSGAFLIVGYFRHGLPLVFELHDTYRMPSLFFMFFTGAAFFAFRHKIILSGALFWSLFLVLICSLVNRHAFFVIYLVVLPYLLFYIAYIPKGKIRLVNNWGDYSYGVYIYAFFVQQCIVSMVHGISILSLFLLSALCTLVLAVISWHFVEKPILDLKDVFSNRLHAALRLQNKA